MLVDWFIVVAQIINFLILVALLRWVLYRPVLSVMGKRKEAVRREWEEARQLQEQARAELAEHGRLRSELEAQQETWRQRAGHEVEQERRQAIEQLRHEIREQRQRWWDELRREQSACLDRLRVQLLEQVQLVTRRALADLASVGLEHQIVEHFLERLERLDPLRHAALLRDLEGQGGHGVRLRTGFAVAPDRREQLCRRLSACLPPLDPDALVFEHDPTLLCGIELRTSDQVIGWNLDQYLGALEQSLSLALSRNPGHAPAQAGG
jgi:F-type H+-transporting ATPase subunit b